MNEELPAARELDASGLRCPLPLLRTKQALHRMAPGEELQVVATDPGSARDIPAWLAIAGHTLLAQEQRDGCWHFRIRRG